MLVPERRRSFQDFGGAHSGLKGLLLCRTQNLAGLAKLELWQRKGWKGIHEVQQNLSQEGLKIDYDDATYEESVKVAGKMKDCGSRPQRLNQEDHGTQTRE